LQSGCIVCAIISTRKYRSAQVVVFGGEPHAFCL
jgi:hypothetical protein